MQALKISVIVMALAIVGIVVLIVVTLAQRVGSDNGGPDVGGPSDGGPAGFGDLTLPVPEGCVLASAEAADQRLILRLDGPVASGCQQAVVLDLESGQVLGRVTATQGP